MSKSAYFILAPQSICIEGRDLKKNEGMDKPFMTSEMATFEDRLKKGKFS